VLQRHLLATVEDEVWAGAAPDDENERRPVAGADDRMGDVRGAVEVIPLTERYLLTSTTSRALAAQDEEPFLVALAVIHRHLLLRAYCCGRKTVRLIPNSLKRSRCLSDSQVAPSSFSCHCNSLTFATNQAPASFSLTT
jgi:hypothetical protein